MNAHSWLYQQADAATPSLSFPRKREPRLTARDLVRAGLGSRFRGNDETGEVKGRLVLVIVAAAMALLRPVPAAARQPADPGLACEQAGMAAERQQNLPEGVLRAIGLVESGRPDPLLGRAAPWPWTMDVAGQPFFFATFDQALEAARAQRPLTADVGCFQISLLYHPSAFPDLARAFDPEENARVAARLLADLRQQTGSWPAAIAAYHSADPDRGGAYAARVLAAWDRSPGSTRMRVTQPVELVVAGVRVITPRLPGSAPRAFALAGSGVLPVVFSGTAGLFFEKSQKTGAKGTFR